jgi:hypothetical protein
MTRKRKTEALFFLFISLAALFLLAAGLSKLAFKPGIPFSLSSELMRLFERGLLGVLFWLLVFGVFLLYWLRRKRSSKRSQATPAGNLLLRFFLLITILIWLYAFSRIPAPGVPGGQAEVQDLRVDAPEMNGNAGAEGAAEEGAQEFAPDPPAWGPLLISLLLAGLAAGFAGLLYLYLRGRGDTPDSPLDRLGEEAQEAVEALHAGADVKDIIIRLYLQMSQILEDERGIQRGAAMTPDEFEGSLIRLGFPPEPVHTLTWLFEQVRYGAQWLGEAEQRQAQGSLGAIIAHCRANGRPA